MSEDFALAEKSAEQPAEIMAYAVLDQAERDRANRERPVVREGRKPTFAILHIPEPDAFEFNRMLTAQLGKNDGRPTVPIFMKTASTRFWLKDGRKIAVGAAATAGVAIEWRTECPRCGVDEEPHTCAAAPYSWDPVAPPPVAPPERVSIVKVPPPPRSLRGAFAQLHALDELSTLVESLEAAHDPSGLRAFVYCESDGTLTELGGVRLAPSFALDGYEVDARPVTSINGAARFDRAMFPRGRKKVGTKNGK